MTSDLAEVYKRVPLLSSNSIRVLNLLPGEENSKIVCTLSVTAIPEPAREEGVDAPPHANGPQTTGIGTSGAHDYIEYEALSYVWGKEPLEYDSIELCGTTTQVTRNLFSALNHLRKPTEPRILWVDAICINQANDDNNTEKNSQVQMMGQVYAHAAAVLAWLGPSDEHSIEAFRVFRAMSDTTPPVRWEQMATTDNLKDELVKAISLFSQESFDAVTQTFSEREYWHRLWVVQEFVGAQNVNLICGHECLTLKEMHDLQSKLVKTFGDTDLQPLRSSLCGLMNIFSLFDAHQEQERRGGNSKTEQILSLFAKDDITKSSEKEGLALFDLMDSILPPARRGTFQHLLRSTGKRRCKEPSDKVYGIQGLVKFPRGTYPIKVDYNKHFLDVYAETILSIMEEDHNMNFILGSESFYVESRDTDHLVDNHPSWIPLQWSGDKWIDLDLYHAAAKTMTGKREVIWKREFPRTLNLTGTIFGNIAYTSNQYSEGGRTEEEILEWLEEIQYGEHTCSNAIHQTFRTFLLDTYLAKDMVGVDTLTRLPDNFISFNNPLFATFVRWVREDSREDLPSQVVSGLVRFLKGCIASNNFFITSSGQPGMTKASIQVGDCVAVLYGSSVPVILRQTDISKDDADASNYFRDPIPSGTIGYSLLGAAYVDEIMDGEVIEQIQKGEKKADVFRIV